MKPGDLIGSTMDVSPMAIWSDPSYSLSSAHVTYSIRPFELGIVITKMGNNVFVMFNQKLGWHRSKFFKEVKR